MAEKILNVGCGNQTYGTDFLDLYPQRPDVLKCNLNKDRFPYPDNIFDEVRAEYVLEHLVDRGNFFSECHRVLKQNGLLHITTDNAAYLGHHALGGSEDHGYASQFGKDDRHYSLFTPKHLASFAEAYGFEVVRIDYPVVFGGKTKVLKELIHLLGCMDKFIMPNIRMEARR